MGGMVVFMLSEVHARDERSALLIVNSDRQKQKPTNKSRIQYGYNNKGRLAFWNAAIGSMRGCGGSSRDFDTPLLYYPKKYSIFRDHSTFYCTCKTFFGHFCSTHGSKNFGRPHNLQIFVEWCVPRAPHEQSKVGCQAILTLLVWSYINKKRAISCHSWLTLQPKSIPTCWYRRRICKRADSAVSCICRPWLEFLCWVYILIVPGWMALILAPMPFTTSPFQRYARRRLTNLYFQN